MKGTIHIWLLLSLFFIEINAISAQPVNDSCVHATLIDILDSDFPFTCITGTTEDATPEEFSNACGIGQFPTVWYKIDAPGTATMINIYLTSEDFSSPVISLFQQLSDCTDLAPIWLTQSNLSCIIGYNGRAEAIGSDIGANEVYYIAITSLNSLGGSFELCVNTISAGNVCVISRDIEIVSRSSGGPLIGPYFPGEVVSVCLNVNSFSASSNGCQWFQGIVPVFGNGWDEMAFDQNGQPLNATVNGLPIGEQNNGIYVNSTWDWFTDVSYHHNSIFLQVGELNNHGQVDMCNLLYQADCPELGGLTGGCCGPCWDTEINSFLPPGWFAYGIQGSCPIPGPPIAVDWGDGNTCGCCMGPWKFCFDLVVRDDINCVEDSTHDLSIAFFTFADGQVGSWTGGPSDCEFDQPAKLTLPFCCSSVQTQHITIDTLCGSTNFDYILPDNGADYWQWTYVTDTITGALEGSGGPGVASLGTLFNPGPDVDSIVFTFLGYKGGICPEFGISATVYLYPQVHIEFDSLVFCGTSGIPYSLDPVISGGTGDLTYQWSPGGDTTPSLLISDPIDSAVYAITVTDSVGCINTAAYVLDVYTGFPVNIQVNSLGFCQAILEGIALGGMDPYGFLWSLPDNSIAHGQSLWVNNEPGEYILEVTDDEGCKGHDTVIVTFFETLVDLGPDTIYTDIAYTLDAGFFPEYNWSTGETTQFITVTPPGCFSVTVTEKNLCMASDTICVEFLTDVEDISQSDFLKIFPNPNDGSFTLSAELTRSDEWRIEIYNSIGTLIYTSQPETVSGKVSKKISLEKAIPGMYMINVWIGENKYSGKLIVEY